MATELGTLAPTFCLSSTSINNNTKKPVKTPLITRIQHCRHEIQQFTRTPSLSPVVRASSGPNSPQPTSPTNAPNSPPPPPPLQDDLTYLLKLAAGSVLGSAVVKYGSAIIPDITRPNLTQALLMISTPVVIAILLLFKGSRKE